MNGAFLGTDIFLEKLEKATNIPNEKNQSLTGTGILTGYLTNANYMRYRCSNQPKESAWSGRLELNPRCLG